MAGLRGADAKGAVSRWVTIVSEALFSCTMSNFSRFLVILNL
jgi:hypothetical protein